MNSHQSRLFLSQAVIRGALERWFRFRPLVEGLVQSKVVEPAVLLVQRCVRGYFGTRDLDRRKAQRAGATVGRTD